MLFDSSALDPRRKKRREKIGRQYPFQMDPAERFVAWLWGDPSDEMMPQHKTDAGKAKPVHLPDCMVDSIAEVDLQLIVFRSIRDAILQKREERFFRAERVGKAAQVPIMFKAGKETLPMAAELCPLQHVKNSEEQGGHGIADLRVRNAIQCINRARLVSGWP